MLKKVFLTAVILMVLSGITANAQLGNIRIGLGVSTLDILGTHLSTRPFLKQTDEVKLGGGSLDQTQTGIRLEIVDELDDDGQFEIPISFEYHFLRGREKAPAAINELGQITENVLRHDVGMATLGLGLNWAFYRITVLERVAKFYIGADFRTTFLMEGTLESETIYHTVNDGQNIKWEHATQPSAIRLGCSMFGGISGELNDWIIIDIKTGVGIINLLNRDDSWGELLTIQNEGMKESFLSTWNFSMCIHFKI